MLFTLTLDVGDGFQSLNQQKLCAISMNGFSNEQSLDHIQCCCILVLLFQAAEIRVFQSLL